MFVSFYLMKAKLLASNRSNGCVVRHIFYCFKHTKNTSQAILAQLQKKGKLVKAFLWQLTQDQDKDSRSYCDKTFYIAAKVRESILWSSPIPKLKHTQLKKHKQCSDAY